MNGVILCYIFMFNLRDEVPGIVFTGRVIDTFSPEGDGKESLLVSSPGG